MSMFDYNPNGPWTLTSGAAITANTTVKIDTVANKVVMTGAGDVPMGWVAEAASAADQTVTVFPLKGVCKILAGGTTAIGDYVKCGASGKFVVETSNTTPTAFTFGQQLNAAGADTVISDIFCR